VQYPIASISVMVYCAFRLAHRLMNPRTVSSYLVMWAAAAAFHHFYTFGGNFPLKFWGSVELAQTS